MKLYRESFFINEDEYDDEDDDESISDQKGGDNVFSHYTHSSSNR